MFRRLMLAKLSRRAAIADLLKEKGSGATSSLRAGGVTAHAGEILALSAQKRHVSTGSSDATIAVWDWPALSLIRRFNLGVDPIHAVRWAASQLIIVWGDGAGRVGALDLKQGNEKWIRQTHQLGCLSVDVTRDGKRIASAGGDGQVRVLASESGEITRILDGSGVMTAVRWTPDGRRLSALNWRGEFFLWDSATWTRLPVRRAADATALVGSTSLSWHPTGKLVAVSEPATAAIVVFRPDWTEKYRRRSNARVNGSDWISWSPTGDALAYLTSTGAAVWFLETNREIRVPSSSDAASLTWSSDGQQLILGFFQGVMAARSIPAKGRRRNSTRD
jgi:WD40 repeat protein